MHNPHNSSPIPGTAQPAFADLGIDQQGVIASCSREAEEIFGYSRSDIVRNPISKLLPELSERSLFKNGQLYPLLEYLCHCGHSFRAVKKCGATFDSELFFIKLANAEDTVRLIVKPCA